MRLVSFGAPGYERPGLVLPDRRIAPLAAVAPDLPGSVRGLLASGRLDGLAARLAAWRGESIEAGSVRLGPPIADPGKIICIGLNYRDHATEQGKEWPAEPLLFCKTPNALAGPADDIRLPSGDCAADYEVELAVVIGARASAVPRERAMAHVAGYLVGNDVSARRWQRADGQWYRAKSCDTFYPCGPALVTADEVDDPARLRLTTRVNGELLQDARLDQLIHDIPALIAYISRDITLEPGDLISTGTPAGVGCFRTPPRRLAADDVVECAIEGLGLLRNRVVAAAPGGAA